MNTLFLSTVSMLGKPTDSARCCFALSVASRPAWLTTSPSSWCAWVSIPVVLSNLKTNNFRKVSSLASLATSIVKTQLSHPPIDDNLTPLLWPSPSDSITGSVTLDEEPSLLPSTNEEGEEEEADDNSFSLLSPPYPASNYRNQKP
eukprot:GHVT01102119.1.p1 GENE.GHVT01102119.1~~GHVT01102119.1.p1  ORF type:complete len:146 (-),score=20.53 GHVT01102119.1:295-732(-)